jgi:type I restriction-modification system DNA methylase subunit
MDNNKNKIIRLIQDIGYKHGTWQVYSDFLELVAIAISNSIDKNQFNTREQIYLQTIKKYSINESMKIAEVFTALVNALEVDIYDVLGQVYQELGLGNKWLGQFFTPFQISLLSGKMMLHDIKEKIKKYGYITVNEPTVGGGSMILGICKAMLEENINYQRHMLVVAQDLDIHSVYMSYIQLSLAGVPAIVIHGNSLLVEERSRWHTPMYVMGGWQIRDLNYILQKDDPLDHRKENKKAV